MMITVRRHQEFLAFMLVMALGIYARCLGYAGKSLWVDEAWRANILLSPGQFFSFFSGADLYGAITSPMYILINRFFTSIFVSEETLRLSALVPSIAVIIYAYKTIKLISTNWILALGCAVIFALNIQMVAYAKELKPYSLELFLYVFTIYQTLLFWNTRGAQTRQYWILATVLFLGLLISPVAVFLWPSVVTAIFWKGCWEQQKKSIFFALGLAIGLGLFSILLYLLSWSRASDSSGLLAYWVEGFRQGGQSYTDFFARNFVGLFRQSFATHKNIFSFFEPMKLFFGAIWISLVLIAIKICIQRQRAHEIILLIGPLLMMVVLNLMGKWPFGPLRINLFILPIFIYLGFWIGVSSRKSWVTGLGLFFLFSFGLSAMPLGRSFYREQGPPTEDSKMVFQKLYEILGQEAFETKFSKATVLMNDSISHAQLFYTTYYDPFQVAIAPFFRDHVQFDRMSEAYRSPELTSKAISERVRVPTWLIYSHLSKAESSLLVSLAKLHGEVSREIEFQSAGLFLLSPNTLRH